MSGMRYRVYEQSGRRAGEGTLDLQRDLALRDLVPGHGAISLEVAPGRWLTFTTTEWASLYLRSVPGEPEHPDAAPDAPGFDLRDRMVRSGARPLVDDEDEAHDDEGAYGLRSEPGP